LNEVEAFMKRKRTHTKNGFTLVEILTTIAIVGILLALLIPALSAVQDTAMKVKQRAQFHSIEVGLEAFYTDTGDYPPSAWNATAYGKYSASQRLAEAMIGRDGFGFHPDSRFREDGKGDIDGDGTLDPAGTGTIYNVVSGVAASSGTANDQSAAENAAVRLGPYLELENANAVKLSDLYGSGNYGNLVDTYVLADVFKITKNLATKKMTGSPILYYRADTTKTQHDGSDLTAVTSSTYNVFDAMSDPSVANDSIVDLAPLATKTGHHPMSPASGGDYWETINLFYTMTQNPNFTSPPRPYRAESFILQSAGPDSLYGTPDDMFNFDQEE
jgi:prepilin-type N-terminal cleavage/methylation domain-containing protein